MRKTAFKMAEWIEAQADFTVGATVTFKQGRWTDDGRFIRITKEITEETCVAIQERVFQKLKARFAWVTTVEDGHGDKRIHAHMAIAVSDAIGFERLKAVFENICGRMDWVDKRIDIREQVTDDDKRAVVFYILKEGTDALALRATRLQA